MSLRNLIRKLQQRRSLKIHWRIQRSGGKNRRRMPDLLWPVWRPVRPVHLGFLKKIPETTKRRGRVSSNSWPSMRRKEVLRKRRSDQIKPKIQILHRSIVSNRLLMCNKVIMLLRHIHLVGRLLHGSGRILTITHLWIIVECICIHILFNILLYIQVMVPLKDQLLLAIIWLKANLTAARSVRKT